MQIPIDRPTLAEFHEANTRITPHIRRTPVIEWKDRPPFPGVDDSTRVFFKLEHLQRSGSFKLRGALNAILSSSDAELVQGVVTASGGNHGVGVAVAAKIRGITAHIYIPKFAPQSTETRLLDLGAHVIRGGASWDDAWRQACQYVAINGGKLIHPFEDLAVIAGQGTIALELLEQAPELDHVLIAVGGGGLLAGVARALHVQQAKVFVTGVEPVEAAAMSKAMQAGHVIQLPGVATIATTLAPLAVGPTTLAIAQHLVSDMVLVTDQEILSAKRLLWEELRLMVEPAGAATLAALMAGRLRRTGRVVGIVVCGANVDL